MTARDDLISATSTYHALVEQLDEQREVVTNALIAALRSGEVDHTEAVDLSPWTEGYVRRIRREAKLPTARTGPKPKANRKPGPAE